MRGGTKIKGYTIVEVMIFLAISGFMFVLAASFISGRQSRSEFQQGMNDINTQVQQTINDVSNGFYPSNSSFNCSAAASGAYSFGGSPVEQGSNQGCTFIGKVMQFSVGGTDAAGYNIYTVIGRQFQTDASTLVPPSTFAEAKPIAATGASGSPDLTQSKTLEWGLQVDSMYQGSVADASHSIGAVGFFSGFSSKNAADSTLDSGAAAVIAAVIPASQPGQGPAQIDSQVPNLATATLDPDPQITICFKGGTNEYGRLNIGTSDNVQGQRLATHIQISSGAPSGICPP